ncbi:MAG: hypothetical protein WD096_02735 [Actinomycetota bacterium]
MGMVISLSEHRRRRESGGEVGRLERAVARLDPAVRRPPGSLTPTLERELRAIASAVTEGRPGEAADRAERLLGLLSHPALSG